MLAPVSQSGVFDPSLAATDMNGRAWMSYSAIDPSTHFPDENTRAESTRLAYSDDHGATWRDLGARVNDTKDFQRRSTKGTWVNEVSALAYDPSAAAEERWQLYWHHYLNVSDKGQFNNGWIGYKSATSPEELPAARETKLFSAKIYNDDNDNEASQTSSPVGSPPVIRLDTLIRT